MKMNQKIKMKKRKRNKLKKKMEKTVRNLKMEMIGILELVF